MKRLPLLALVFATLSFNASAGEYGLFYLAAGAGTSKANLSVGAGTDIDVLEMSAIDLGTVGGNYGVKFRGLSLVQNAVPVKKFNLMFRVGFGRATTTLANGLFANRSGINAAFFGLGGQYQPDRQLAFRAELNRIPYATSADGSTHSAAYPVTISALYIF